MDFQKSSEIFFAIKYYYSIVVYGLKCSKWRIRNIVFYRYTYIVLF